MNANKGVKHGKFNKDLKNYAIYAANVTNIPPTLMKSYKLKVPKGLYETHLQKNR